MRVLLDENLPQSLRLNLGGHEVMTTAYRGWAGLSNGALIRAAEDDGFHILITADQGLNYQQNLAGRKLAVIVLSTNKSSVVLQGAPRIIAAIEEVIAGGFCFVRLERDPAVD